MPAAPRLAPVASAGKFPATRLPPSATFSRYLAAATTGPPPPVDRETTWRTTAQERFEKSDAGGMVSFALGKGICPFMNGLVPASAADTQTFPDLIQQHGKLATELATKPPGSIP
jgi:hypothetical protein